MSGRVRPVEIPAWHPYPEVSVTLPDEGKVTGAFTLVVQGNGYAYAGTRGAHVNDDNLGVTYRGVSMLVSLRLHPDPVTGVWRDTSPHVTRRDNWSDAPPSYRDAVVAAVGQAVADVLSVSPELVAAGEYADAMQDTARHAREVNDAAEALNTARAAHDAAVKRAAIARTAVQ